MESLFETLAAELEITVDYLFEEFIINEDINLAEILTTYVDSWGTVTQNEHSAQNGVLLTSRQEFSWVSLSQTFWKCFLPVNN